MKILKVLIGNYSKQINSIIIKRMVLKKVLLEMKVSLNLFVYVYALLFHGGNSLFQYQYSKELYLLFPAVFVVSTTKHFQLPMPMLQKCWDGKIVKKLKIKAKYGDGLHQYSCTAILNIYVGMQHSNFIWARVLNTVLVFGIWYFFTLSPALEGIYFLQQLVLLLMEQVPLLQFLAQQVITLRIFLLIGNKWAIYMTGNKKHF